MSVPEQPKLSPKQYRRIIAGLATGFLIVSVLAVLLFFSSQTAQENGADLNHAATARANEQEAVAAQETSDFNVAALVDVIATSEAKIDRAEQAESDAEQRAEEAATARANAEAAQIEAEAQARLAEARHWQRKQTNS
jgi:uncharacterized membrane protein YqiK